MAGYDVRGGFVAYHFVARVDDDQGDHFGRRLEFGHALPAQAFVRRLLDGGTRHLRRALALTDGSGGTAARDEEIVDRVMRRLADGTLRVYDVYRPPVGQGGTELVEATATKQTSWIEILFVDDVTGDPVGNAKVGVVLPGASRTDLVTPPNGLLSFHPCQPGSGRVEASFGGASIGDTLDVLGLGEASMSPLRGVPFPRTKGKPWSLAVVVRHRVRSTDSLDSIAKANSMTWQDLAKFNFGTDDPKKVNLALRDQVGSRKKTKDGKNYMFDDADQPGIVYVPKPVDLGPLATADTHVVRTRPVDQPTQHFLFSC